MLHYSVLILGWFGLMLGALQLQNIDMGHSFCGAWGCGPPTNALLGMHLFWFACLAPPFWLACTKLKVAWSVVGKVIVGLAILALIGFGFYDYFGQNQSYYQAGYVWQRYCLSLVSLSDVPIVQMLTIGAGMWAFGKGCTCCQPGEFMTHDINTNAEAVVAAGNE